MALFDYIKKHIQEINSQARDNAVSLPLSNDDLKAVHFALMPECGMNPFFFYVPAEGKMLLAENTSFEEVKESYGKVLRETAGELGVDVSKLESWLPSCAEAAWKEVERMEATGWIKSHCEIEDVYDAIRASRVFYNNGLSLEELCSIEEGKLPVGYDIEHPIVITEARGYVHLEYVVAEAILNLKNLFYKPAGQQLIMLGDKQIDKLHFKVFSDDSDEEEMMEICFDISAGYKSL